MRRTDEHRAEVSSEPDQSEITNDVKSEGRLHRWVERLIFAALLCLIPFTAIPYGSVHVWWEAAFECLIFVLTGVWVIEGLVRGEWRVGLPSMLVPAVVLVVYALLQTVPFRSSGSVWTAISVDPYTTRLFALKLCALLLAGLLLARYTNSARRLRALIFIVLLTALGSAIFGIVRETTQHNQPGFGLPQLMPSAGYAQFINRNHFAYLMEMGLGLTFGMLVGRSEQRSRLLYIATILPLAVALILANSRGGILSMFSQVVFLFLMYGFVASKDETRYSEQGIGAVIHSAAGKFSLRVVLIVCLLGALVAGVVWIGGEPLTKRLETIKSEVANEDEEAGEGSRRMLIWRATVKIFKDHPFTGIGFGGYWVAITEYYDVPGQKRPYQAHNDYLELLVSGGLIGLGIGIWFLVATIRRVRKTFQSRNSFRRAAALGALIGLFGVAVHSIVDFGLHITINALIFVTLLVIATCEIRLDEDKEELVSNRTRHRRVRTP